MLHMTCPKNILVLIQNIEVLKKNIEVLKNLKSLETVIFAFLQTKIIIYIFIIITGKALLLNH